MGNNINSFGNDYDTLYISSRVFFFVLENTKKINASIDLTRFVEMLPINKGVDNYDKIEIEVLIDFFETCFDSQFTYEDFYKVGNRISESHFSFITLLYKLNSGFIKFMNKEMNFIKFKFEIKEDKFSLFVEIFNVVSSDARKICAPILRILNGFISRLFQVYLNNEPSVKYNECSLELSYRQNFYSNFDIARHITNEQFFFSRLKNQIYSERVEQEINNKVEYYLFRDISFSIEEIATKMDISVRALQRKLKEQETSFRNIKEFVRMELSKTYLSDLSLNIQEVSELLAYSDRSAFEKAFKKWYGKNPIVFRADLS